MEVGLLSQTKFWVYILIPKIIFLGLDLGVVSISEDKALTSRILISGAAHLFDPMGFATPWTIKAKLVIQKSWKISDSFDEPPPLDLASE